MATIGMPPTAFREHRGPQSTFPQKANLTYNTSCFECKRKQAGERDEKRSDGDTRAATGGARRGPNVQPVQGHTTLDWNECVALLEAHKNDAFEFETFVSMTGDSATTNFGGMASGKDVADTIAKAIWDISGYPFIYKKSKKSSASDAVRTYSYYCAQNEDEVKKSQLHDEPRKRRTRMKMSRFPCKGTLQITVDDDNLEIPQRLKLKHHQSHLHYVDISISKNIHDFVEAQKHESAATIWTRVLAENPGTEVTQKQIYALWSELNEGAWRLDDDQVKSAQMILEKLEGTDVEIIPIRAEPGIHAIAFALKEVVDGWAEEREELAMDSTWKTNAAQYKVYEFVAEAKGQAMPFGFLFTVSTGDAAEGAKTRMLSDVLEYISERCPNIMFTLSDKEPAEINACRAKISQAKYQLCYWHAITYVEECLGKNKPPARYDPRKAHKIFDFIDPTWAPGVTAVYADEDEEGDGENEGEGEEMGTQIPKPSQTCIPPVFVLKTGDIRVPVWPNPPKIKKKMFSEFCPKDFRADIIEMYRTHLHQHPKYSGMTQKNRTSQPKKSTVELFGRCMSFVTTTGFLRSGLTYGTAGTPHNNGRFGLTFHRDLAEFNRPRLDLVVSIVFKSLLPRVKRTLEYVRGLRRIGRPQALAGWQSAPNTKGRAERLAQLAEEESRESGTYATDIKTWVCPCPHFFKSRFLMCKHLIREANKLLNNRPLTDLRFFLDLRRNHFPPYYSIPGIHTEAESTSGEEFEPKEVLVLGIRGAVLPVRAERPTEDTRGTVQTADSLSERVSDGASAQTGSVEDIVNALTDETPGVVDEEELSDSDRDVRVTVTEARKTHLKRCWEDMMYGNTDWTASVPRVAVRQV
ncbi:hypothetical protein B0H13DRAFT_2359391 [Mycena leptocephala]|nr:hypothetical protein B0H13DRAFT_2359391 [Mycena leptocephala]